ncbi:MAG TPA: transposase [Planctomycetaceae bacterium]|nr:transposase [Planctomycetaceae bacterium]
MSLAKVLEPRRQLPHHKRAAKNVEMPFDCRVSFTQRAANLRRIPKLAGVEQLSVPGLVIAFWFILLDQPHASELQRGKQSEGRHTDVKRLAKHLRHHRQEWFLFLHDPDIPATNNHGERPIRAAVMLRKIGSCHREILHAVAHEILASLTTTCRQRGHPFLALAKKLWLSPTPRAIPIPA